MHDDEVDNSIIQTLRNKGYKATPQRVAISKIALCSQEHPNIKKIYHEARKSHPTVSLATVYKTLQTLRDSGLIQELNFPEWQARFEPNLNPHINLICIRCGKIQDLNDAGVKELVKKVAEAAKFLPTAQRLDIYGICAKCSKKSEHIQK